MEDMFSGCTGLISIDVSTFDTAKVTNTRSMFTNCSKLTNLDVSSFDTANMTRMNGMFQNCSKLASLDLSKFDTANVTAMSLMFGNCNALTILTTGINFKFIDKYSAPPGTWQNTAGETFTNGTFPSNVADTYTRIK